MRTKVTPLSCTPRARWRIGKFPRARGDRNSPYTRKTEAEPGIISDGEKPRAKRERERKINEDCTFQV